MSGVRTELVNVLGLSLVGPAGGSQERLARERDPRDEYIVGVLAPVPPDGVAADVATVYRDIDSDAELLEEGSEDDDDDDDASSGTAPSYSPSLDPRSQPHSIGLTFVVSPFDHGQIHIAATYARYTRRDDDQWEREAYFHIWNISPVKENGFERCPGAATLRFWSRPVPGHSKARRVSVFLVNSAVPGAVDRPPETKLLIFQPQIRIALDEGMSLESILPISQSHAPDDVSRFEEESLALLYCDRPILARGHMCSATWRSVDPECEMDSPFAPLDLESLPTSDRPRFKHPHARTTFLPIVPVSSPSMAWDLKYGPVPELDPQALAQMWDAKAIATALQPLVNGYSTWIAELREDIKDIPSHLQPTGERHARMCEELSMRLQRGIALLEKDADVRLAFCFANEAMSMQAAWRSKPMVWRPFQLAFILLCIDGVASTKSSDRQVCDLLWFPTGGGKTEAYLGLAAFTLGLRRLKSDRDASGRRTGSGVAVISRYTLRLLTIQQFRRALRMLLACEMLRVRQTGPAIGWRPDSCNIQDEWLWGTHRFSTGLWVGGGVTPNRLQTIGWPDEIPGALELLRRTDNPRGHGEPAQVPRCPACDAHLAIPQPRHGRQERAAFAAGKDETLHLAVFIDGDLPSIDPTRASTRAVQVQKLEFYPLPSGSSLLTVEFTAGPGGVSAPEIDSWWDRLVKMLPGFSRVESARASRPGYFIRAYRTAQRKDHDFDFEIYCPNPGCPTAAPWMEGIPVPLGSSNDGWQENIECFRSAGDPSAGVRIPIPALTVDDQIYGHPPSLVVATVDKFARLAFEPRAASMFGFVEHYHARHGYYRLGVPGGGAKPFDDHPPVSKMSKPIAPFPPPDLILQDELHLIDGPLGSMVGLYECAIDLLGRRADANVGPKYIASTATVREAESQVISLFARKLSQFPPPGLRFTDNFFARTQPESCQESGGPGRLYVGVCSPGKGAQTPIVRIWSALLQAVEDSRRSGSPDAWIDNYWTLVGYFNAVRELAGATGLYRQDIRQRMLDRSGPDTRELHEPLELSSRADPLQLPSLLSMLELRHPDAVDAVLATSMFGTGVDVDRLGLMVVHGQPKTTSSYIQATGRVGRQLGGLVVTFLRASRPRDLDHYEFFTGYHQQLYRAVEPVTVSPFSPRARERALGPLCVVLLRQSWSIEGVETDWQWRVEQVDNATSRSGSRRMAVSPRGDEVKKLPDAFEARARLQPHARRPSPDVVKNETLSELDRWKNLAQRSGGTSGNLLYYESAMTKDPSHPVVLGDAQHERRQLPVAFENAPTSLRYVEATTGFRV